MPQAVARQRPLHFRHDILAPHVYRPAKSELALCLFARIEKLPSPPGTNIFLAS